MTYVHIHAPAVELSCQVNECPTCERPRRMLLSYAEWYGPTWTCAGCGDSWTDEGRDERPFSPNWRRQSIERARKRLASIGVPS